MNFEETLEEAQRRIGNALSGQPLTSDAIGRHIAKTMVDNYMAERPWLELQDWTHTYKDGKLDVKIRANRKLDYIEIKFAIDTKTGELVDPER